MADRRSTRAQQQRPPRTRPSIPASWWAVAIVIVLAIVVGALAWMAYARAQTPPPEETPRVTPTMGVKTTTPTPTPTPTPTSTVAAATGAAERFLAISDGDIWRATAGECGVTAPVIERSTDQGATWTDVTPTYRGIGQVLSLEPYAADQAYIVALMGDACELQGLRTFTYGQFWEPNDDILANATYVDPASSNTIVTPAGAMDAPCEVPTSVNGITETTALICGSEAGAIANASAWQSLTPNAVAVHVSNENEIATLTSDPATCDGLVSTYAGISTCVPGLSPDNAAAVTVVDATPWLWSGDTVQAVG